MELFTLIFLGHLAGVIAAVGGATVSDALFFKTIKNRHVSRDEFKLLSSVGHVVWSGLALAVITGIGMLLHQLSTTGSITYLENSYFQAKLILAGVVFLNGLVFHLKVLPFIENHLDEDMREKEFVSRFWLFSMTGAISGTSWWSIVVLAVLTPSLPLLYILNIYLLIVFAAALFAYIIFSHTIFQDMEIQETLPNPSTTLLASLCLIIIASVAAGSIYHFEGQSGETHTVCIEEGPPWFNESVLEIAEGDTVTWEYCDGDHGIHTHPIEAVDGPEHFSSGFGLVGKEEDNEEFSHTFTEEGVYTYICPTHPYMEGKIAVGEEYHGEVEDVWPKESAIDEEDILERPEVGTEGDIWVNTQFERVEDQEHPGTITVIDGETWETEEVISHENFNNPHNLWNSYDGEHIFQTQWHSDKVSKIDVETREVVDDKEIGNAPAHLFVHPEEERLYITLNNEDRVVVTDLELNVVDEIESSFGAHGVWIDPEADYMSVAATLDEKLDIIDLDQEEVVETFDAPGYPLATQITHSGEYAMISQLFENQVRFVDLDSMTVEKDVEVGAAPIWAMPGPNEEYIFVPNTGSATVSVIELETLEVVETLDAGAGAHGINFAEKTNEEGHLAYVSNKYENAVTVIDIDEMETKGHIELGEDQIGGNGILTMPNPYEEVKP